MADRFGWPRAPSAAPPAAAGKNKKAKLVARPSFSTEFSVNTRHFDSRTRRFVLAGLTGGSLVALLGRGEAAKKNRKKKRRCRKRRKDDPATCADVCPAAGSFAFHLVGGGDVCATRADPSGCVACDDDGECAALGPARFCVKNFTNLATGAVADFSGLCGASPGGICVLFEPCVLGS